MTITDLQRYHSHRIARAKLVNSKFGPVVFMELEQYTVFLPRRVTITYPSFLQFFADFKDALVFKVTNDYKQPHETNMFEIFERKNFLVIKFFLSLL